MTDAKSSMSSCIASKTNIRRSGPLGATIIRKGLRLGAYKPAADANQRPCQTSLREYAGLRERDLAAEREPTDHRAIDAAGVEQRLHVRDGQVEGIPRAIFRALRQTVTAHVPGDEAVPVLQDPALRIPH